MVTLFSSDKSDDAEMLRQMRLLYCRSNRLIRMFNKCSKYVVSVQPFIDLIFGLNTKIYIF